ncbi:PAS domain-containing protein [Alteromonas flava]|uniref:PAS domain-containing protein n=1 Tax=Alteromonas flava TaxID=2048003 RepID=UPI000C2832D8|nr:PAS domain S-box protein [Alteromonas flava]
MHNIRKLNAEQVGKLVEILLEKTFEAVVITDADPLEHKILYANSRFCEMTGYSKEELYGSSPRMLSGADTNPRVIARLKNALKKGEHFIGAATNYRKDGTPYPVQWNVYPIPDANGEPEFFISIQKDLSDLKRSLTRLKSSSEHFRIFLRELKTSKTEISTNEHVIKSAENELKDNAKLLSKYVNPQPDDSDDIDDFFDFDDMAVLTESGDEAAPKTVISAATFLSDLSVTKENLDDICNISRELKGFITTYDIEDLDESDRRELITDLQEMANAVFFVEEFIDISISLSELSVVLYHHYDRPFDLIISEALKGLVNDLFTWTTEVFVDKTAQDIHWLDDSIIGSCKQTLVFLRMK